MRAISVENSKNFRTVNKVQMRNLVSVNGRTMGIDVQGDSEVLGKLASRDIYS